MANAKGEAVETPTQDLPFKVVVSTDRKIVRECIFASRPAAQVFLVATLKELAKSGTNEGRLG
jgi:hypothetical protein